MDKINSYIKNVFSIVDNDKKIILIRKLDLILGNKVTYFLSNKINMMQPADD